MADLGLHGVIRGKPIRTTVQDKTTPRPCDHVNRVFHAPSPNMLWLSDFTYVNTWLGFVYVAFVIDAYARRIVGWRVSRTAHASFVLDALEQALLERRPVHRDGLVHHSDRGSQYVSIRYTGRNRHRTVCGQCRRQLRERPGRYDQRPLQGRVRPSARAMASTEAVESQR
jgi:putative transposase